MEARSEDEALGMHSVRRHWRQRDAAVVGARHPSTGRLPAIGRQDGASSAMARRPRTPARGRGRDGAWRAGPAVAAGAPAMVPPRPASFVRKFKMSRKTRKN